MPGRIIKVLMRQQLGTEEEPKKEQKPNARPSKTGSRARNPEPETIRGNDIDPAEFFDPEEFGDVWRGYDDHLRP